MNFKGLLTATLAALVAVVCLGIGLGWIESPVVLEPGWQIILILGSMILGLAATLGIIHFGGFAQVAASQEQHPTIL
ncbi:hypothetical protein I8H83_00150 [Candidatus Saccharibacteria bacterium]|nr:hypothetical protein [Candidatus Saccharibacteria bacterium]MBH2007001.1 hypothetical protein [Candidatus Saccharibacteria bacterium]